MQAVKYQLLLWQKEIEKAQWGSSTDVLDRKAALYDTVAKGKGHQVSVRTDLHSTEHEPSQTQICKEFI